VSTKHLFLVHIIPMRRCNLDCATATRRRRVPPVPLEEMKAAGYAGDMGTSIITISGGEPSDAPELDDVIRHIGNAE
jgi:MoaA/NifB/PqqE/SkfB family radical SAM enzyme